jgi:apolipoprotein N-acyltransferase
VTRLFLLIAGVSLLLVSNGQIIAPFAAIACAPLLLTYAREAPPLRGLALLALVFAAANCVMWWDIIPAPGALYFLVAATYGLCHWIPYAADRLLAASMRSFASTLVFPAAYALVEAALDLATPYGSWSSIAYSQPPDGGFAQLAAIGGLPLVTFALAWVSSCMVWAWRERLTPSSSGALACGALVLVCVSLAPEMRTRILSEPRTVVTIVTLSPAPDLRSALDRALRAGGAESEAAATAATALKVDLLSRSARAAQDGAQIVVWSETAARLLKRDEQGFLQQASEVARANNLHLFAAYGAFDPQAERPFANRLAAFTPTEGLVWVYDKAHPIVGAEANVVGAGVARMPVLETPFGRVAVAICHDADFPRYIRQASRDGVDVLINPADDWPAIQRLHANMAAFRALENGLTLVRAANGVSQIVNPLGEVLATRNSFAGDGQDMIARAAIRRAPVFPHGATLTLFFAGAVLVGAAIWRLAAVVKRRRA